MVVLEYAWVTEVPTFLFQEDAHSLRPFPSVGNAPWFVLVVTQNFTKNGWQVYGNMMQKLIQQIDQHAIE